MKQEWNTLEWLNNARGLVHWASHNRSTGPIMLVIRHSHREDSQEVQQLLRMRLTEFGHRMAFQFGRKSPSLQRVEIYYSRPLDVMKLQRISLRVMIPEMLRRNWFQTSESFSDRKEMATELVMRC